MKGKDKMTPGTLIPIASAKITQAGDAVGSSVTWNIQQPGLYEVQKFNPATQAWEFVENVSVTAPTTHSLNIGIVNIKLVSR